MPRPQTPLLPLRDQLALDRTELANHRTWLASARAALTLFVSGASFLQFFDHLWIWGIGWGFIGISGPVLAFGLYRYRRQHRQLLELAEVERRRIAER
ncbi:MAG: DUF202 domain-containing protein [Deltaproteobacteria bacterium]|nr:DUF202 domain-containing protein [Deltaproteobacteria bacterium]